MTEDKKEKATEHARQAKGQARAAATNAVRAVEEVAEPAVEAAADAAQETAERVADTAETVGRRFNLEELLNRSSDAGWGFFATTVSLYTGKIAFDKFRDAITGRRS